MQYKMYAGGIGLFSGLHCTFCLPARSVCLHVSTLAENLRCVHVCVCTLPPHSGHLQQTKHPLWPSTFRGFWRRAAAAAAAATEKEKTEKAPAAESFMRAQCRNGNKVPVQPALFHLSSSPEGAIERAYYGRCLFYTKQ